MDNYIYYNNDKDKIRFLFIDIDNINITNAQYGTYDKSINVLDILIKMILNKKFIISVNNRTFKKDPHFRKLKSLIITLQDGKKYELNENEYVSVKCEDTKKFLDYIKPVLKEVKEKIKENKKEKEEIINSKKYYINCNYYEPTIGFIILRNVINRKSDELWQRCYDSIRKFYDNRILIIDDNSNRDYLTVDKEMTNYSIIYSEFKGRGEFLPYYYYNLNNFCERVIVFHDSMYLVEKIDFFNIKGYKNFTKIFSFNNRWYNQDIKYLENQLKSLNEAKQIIKYHQTNKKKLTGCAGCCFVIDHSFLKDIFEKYKLNRLLKNITNRDQRKSFERSFPCILEFEKSLLDFKTCQDMFGYIHEHIGRQNNNKKVKIIKEFIGR